MTDRSPNPFYAFAIICLCAALGFAHAKEERAFQDGKPFARCQSLLILTSRPDAMPVEPDRDDILRNCERFVEEHSR